MWVIGWVKVETCFAGFNPLLLLLVDQYSKESWWVTLWCSGSGSLYISKTKEQWPVLARTLRRLK